MEEVEQKLRDRAMTLAIEAFVDTDQFVDGDYTEENCRRALVKLANSILEFLTGTQPEKNLVIKEIITDQNNDNQNIEHKAHMNVLRELVDDIENDVAKGILLTQKNGKLFATGFNVERTEAKAMLLSAASSKFGFDGDKQ